MKQSKSIDPHQELQSTWHNRYEFVREPNRGEHGIPLTQRTQRLVKALAYGVALSAATGGVTAIQAAEVTRCDVSHRSLTFETMCSPPLTERGVPESGSVGEVVQQYLGQGYLSLPAPLLTYELLLDTHPTLSALTPGDQARIRQLIEERVTERCEFIAPRDALVTGRFVYICPSATTPQATSHVIPLLMPASSAQQGFARIINRSDTAGTVRIHGTDDSGQRYGPITLSLEAKATAHFNSRDLEQGNSSKGLSGGLGDGEGNWRLELDTGLDIDPSAYIRTVDGFLTTMHEVTRTIDVDGEERHHVPIFNPGGNESQRSVLRVVNLTGTSVHVTIEGRDDKGERPPRGEVGLTLGGAEARMLSAQELESGGAGFSGRFGDGTGKWQLFVTADGAIEVMSLLQSPTGHLTNMSVSGLRETEILPPPPPWGSRSVALASYKRSMSLRIL